MLRVAPILKIVSIFAVGASLFSQPALSQAPILSTVTITGNLTDAQGNPIRYPSEPVNLGARLWVYEAETAEAPLWTSDYTASASIGHFTLSIPIHSGIPDTSMLWFELSIDTDQNGLDEADRFQGRFTAGTLTPATRHTIRSFFVPFSTSPSLEAFPVSTDPPPFSNEATPLLPFSTPSGGMTFNHMLIYIAMREVLATEPFSLAIYNAAGDRIAYSGIIDPPPDTRFSGYVDIEVEKSHLEEGGLYFFASRFSQPLANPENRRETGILSPFANPLLHPSNGHIFLDANSVVLPQNIDLNRLRPNPVPRAPSVMLYQANDDSATAAVWTHTRATEANRVRWIPADYHDAQLSSHTLNRIR